MDWARILAHVTGMVDQELLARNEYLAAENRILKAQLMPTVLLGSGWKLSSNPIRRLERGSCPRLWCRVTGHNSLASFNSSDIV
jgi:hypothetical protein